MSIDEAIKHCEEVAQEKERHLKVYENMDEDRPLFKEEENECKECAAEHRQLADWLKELKSFKEKDEAKAVRYEGDGYADGAMVYDKAFCPSCNHEFEEDSDNCWECDFCPNCGQRLRWDE